MPITSEINRLTTEIEASESREFEGDTARTELEKAKDLDSVRHLVRHTQV